MVSEVVKTHLPDLKTCFIATDYTCSPSVKDSSLDRYFIPATSLGSDFLGGGITPERMRACGIPVRQMFQSHGRKEEAKRAFGIPADHRHLVMMCGSMGCGPIMSIARRIGRDLPDDQDLTIVCGTNDRLFDRLSRRFYGVKNEYNKDFFLRAGGAATGKTPREIARVSLKLLSDENTLEKMGDALDTAVPHDAAANILSEMTEAEEEGELA